MKLVFLAKNSQILTKNWPSKSKFSHFGHIGSPKSDQLANLAQNFMISESFNLQNWPIFGSRMLFLMQSNYVQLILFKQSGWDSIFNLTKNCIQLCLRHSTPILIVEKSVGLRRARCGNFRIFLSFRFYVKSTL